MEIERGVLLGGSYGDIWINNFSNKCNMGIWKLHKR